MTTLVGSKNDPVLIKGVHGGEGTLEWKCFARLHMLNAPWVAFEWVSIERGAAVGDHTHSRTEEIYFIISGRGEMDQDGEISEVGPGDLIMTRRGVTHALTNTGTGPVEFLVVEVFPPEVDRLLPEYAPEAHPSAEGGKTG